MFRTQCNVREFLFYPLSFFQCFGLVRFDPRTGRKSTLKSFFMIALMLYLIVESVVNMFFLVHVRQPFTKVSFLRTCSDFVLYGSETITGFLSVYISFFYFDRKLYTVKMLFLIDEMMEEIGMRVRYNKGWWRPKILIVVGGLTIWLVIDLIAFHICNPNHMLMILVIRYSAGLIYWADICYFITILKIIKNHFEKLNQQWVRLTNEYDNVYYFKKVELVRRIRILNRMHGMLRELCQILSLSYGFQLAFLTISFLIKIVIFTYLIIARGIAYFLDVDGGTNVIVFNSYFASSIIVYFVLCFSILHVVVNTRDEGNKTICLLHTFHMEAEMFQLNNYLKIYANQLFDESIEFRAREFFVLNFSLIYQVTGNYCMYLIILLQFHFLKMGAFHKIY